MEKQEQGKKTNSLEYPFDFERYIEEQLREIGDLDERKYARKILLEGLGKCIQAMEQKYKKLEYRIFQEMDTRVNQYHVCFTIVKRQYYDPTNESLFPVCPEDFLLLQKEQKKIEEEKEKEKKGRQIIETVYLEADENSCKAFLEEQTCTGWVSQGESKKELTFLVKKSFRYQRAVEKLYETFLDNQIPWETVNTAYLDHFFDLYLCEEENLDFDTEKIEFNFGEFDTKVRRDLIPLWNIESMSFSSKEFRMPCMNDIYYEHEIILEDDSQEYSYLIQFQEDIAGVRFEGRSGVNGPEKIVIKSRKEQYDCWRAFRLKQGQLYLSLDYSYPLLSNRRKDSFVQKFTASMGQEPLTKADIFRQITELDIEGYVKLLECEVVREEKKYPPVEGMNWFIKGEFFPMDTRRVLLFSFRRSGGNHYLQDSMVRYAMSHMQMKLNEYRCVGRIVEAEENGKVSG